MKKLLDWQSKTVVSVLDEISLWSAPFGRLLLEEMPMQKGATVVDLGFGTGFPLIELSQRFGTESKIYGVDVWEEGIKRTMEKIKIFEIDNIEILAKSATEIAIEDGQVDTITSNLGVNNFDEKEKVYREIRRILKQHGRLCITTNPIGTFEELFVLFEAALKEMNLTDSLIALENYIAHRKDQSIIVNEFETIGLTLVKSKLDATSMRFLDGKALLNHALIRVGFRVTWQEMVGEEQQKIFFNKLVKKIDEVVAIEGCFKMRIPMLYLEFEKI